MANPTVSEAVVHVGDWGFPIRIRVMTRNAAGQLVATDISSATTKNIKLESPDRSTQVAKAGVFVTDGSDGEYEYDVENGLLNQAGYWYVFGDLVLPDGARHTAVGLMLVQAVRF